MEPRRGGYPCDLSRHLRRTQSRTRNGDWGRFLKVVILRALKLGDFLTGVPAYRAIRRAFPNDRIVLAAPRELEPLVDLLDGTIDEVAHVRELETLPPQACGADVGIDLHGKGPESQRLLLAAGSRKLIAFFHGDVPASSSGPAHRDDEHEVARWCRLLEAFGIATDVNDLDVRVPASAVSPNVRGATLIHPGAASESRRWPVERWVRVARAERERGRTVVITGGPAEIERSRDIACAACVPSDLVYAGRTNLAELAALVAAAGRVVCGDTGVAHLATAFRTPSVVLFGPTPPATWGPPQRTYHRVLWNGTTGNPHGANIDPGLIAISVERVVAELRMLPT